MTSFTHQPGAVVARKVLLAYLDEAPKSLLCNRTILKHLGLAVKSLRQKYVIAPIPIIVSCFFSKIIIMQYMLLPQFNGYRTMTPSAFTVQLCLQIAQENVGWLAIQPDWHHFCLHYRLKKHEQAHTSAVALAVALTGTYPNVTWVLSVSHRYDICRTLCL